ncbi:MAG TPA: hypothetical protein VGC66_18820 [Pyrinomonadaceae bacterium]|jgi:hypothetical protein
MKDDYLWDKTGEADPEIQHLERVLGQLRHKRSSQELLPALDKLPRTNPRPFSKLLAIAATLAFALLALGAFLVNQRQLKKQEVGNSTVVMVNPGLPEPTIAPSDAKTSRADEIKQPDNDRSITVADPVSTPRRSVIESRRRSPIRIREASITEREQAEGLLAKERLIKALEITSSQLNFVQKKVKGDAKLGPSS